MIDFKKHGIKAVILDMDGVLWKDSEPIGNLPIIFQRFTDENVHVILATNNATSTVGQYLQKIKHNGCNTFRRSNCDFRTGSYFLP